MLAQLARQLIRAVASQPAKPVASVSKWPRPIGDNAGTEAMVAHGLDNRERIAEAIENATRPLSTTEIGRIVGLSAETSLRHVRALMAEDPPRAEAIGEAKNQRKYQRRTE